MTLTAALVTGNQLFYQLTYLLASLILFSLMWTWTSATRVKLERESRSNRAQVGRLAEERIILSNIGLFPKLWLEIRDHSDLPGHRAGRIIESLPRQSQRSWTVRTVCQRRGRFTLGPMTIISSDPFGLFKMKRKATATDTLIVYPATFDLPAFATPIGRLPGGDAMRRRTHYITTNVAGVREYFPGDSFNRIHWPSTARHGRLIVKEFELDPMADIWLFLDMEEGGQVGSLDAITEADMLPSMWATGPARRIDPSTEEYGVTVTASLAKHFLNQDRAVGLVAYGQRREIIQADRGERQLAKILEALAVIKAEGKVPLAEVLTAEGRYLGRHITAIVITPSVWADWVSALRDLSRRGLRGIAVLIEASTFGKAPSSLETVSLLAGSGIPTYLVKCGDRIDAALSLGAQQRN
ncbi:MAG: DUF58 domain-containing protein [Anaerolineae bacterium]